MAQSSRKRSPLSSAQIILIVVAIVSVRLALDFGQRIVEGKQKIAEQRQLEAEIQALLAEQATLEALKTYYSSDAFVEAWAHNQGKMVHDGEVLVIPILLGEPSPTPALLPESQVSLSPWQVWWLLFFDSLPSFDVIPGG